MKPQPTPAQRLLELGNRGRAAATSQPWVSRDASAAEMLAKHAITPAPARAAPLKRPTEAAITLFDVPRHMGSGCGGEMDAVPCGHQCTKCGAVSATVIAPNGWEVRWIL